MFKKGDRVRIVKKIVACGRICSWIFRMDNTIGEIGVIDGNRDHGLLVTVSSGQFIYNPKSLELVKENKMDAIKMDIDTIKKRVLEDAVVVKKDDEIHLLIPARSGDSYFSLVEGSTGWTNNYIKNNCDWAIRKGDMCEFSDNGADWYEACFSVINKGIFQDSTYPFRTMSGSEWRFICPIPTDSKEKVEALARLEKAEKELKEARKLVEEMK